MTSRQEPPTPEKKARDFNQLMLNHVYNNYTKSVRKAFQIAGSLMKTDSSNNEVKEKGRSLLKASLEAYNIVKGKVKERGGYPKKWEVLTLQGLDRNLSDLIERLERGPRWFDPDHPDNR